MSNKSIKNKDQKTEQRVVPQDKETRDQLVRWVRSYVQDKALCGPLSLEQLQAHGEAIIRENGIGRETLDFLVVLINNQLWLKTMAATPHEKRLLLLPNCLRDSEHCPAEFDDLGLACRACGRCVIGSIKEQAESLGMMVLVAEGSPIVMSLIQTGKIEAVIGVSCLDVLEKTFPYIEAGAIPGVAIPLLFDGCVDTRVDADWVLDVIYERSFDAHGRIDLQEVRDRVNQLFEPESLKTVLGLGDSFTETLALRSLGGEGKRWRPLLTVYTHKAVAQETDLELSGDLKKLAVAVECFHKASLVHDDIEDGDLLRYDKQTVHAEFGIPIALNLGDFLIGLGYRLLGELELPQDRKAEILKVVSEGHLELCLGQGLELEWMRRPGPLTMAEVLAIFQKKTATAFEVALKLGALSVEFNPELNGILEAYSDAIGIAYQIKDDINDFCTQADFYHGIVEQPSIFLAILWDRAGDEDKQLLQSLWGDTGRDDGKQEAIVGMGARLRARTIALQLLESYKQQAISAIELLDNMPLKSLLRRIVSKLFYEIDIMECCDDYKNGIDESHPTR